MISTSKSEDLFDALQLLSVLAEVQQWEASNSEFIRGQSSRQLYFGLIRHIDSRALLIDSMKEIYYDEAIQLTERAIRLTIRAFEADGMVVVGQADEDRRSRQIFLTSKLQQHIIAHADMLRKTINKNYHLIKR
jgi:hypothetical protein